MGELLNRENFILQMTEEKNLAHHEISQNVEPFTGITDLADIELHHRLDMIMGALSVSTLSINLLKVWIAKILVSQIHPDLFVKEFEFFPESRTPSPYPGL
ncbi:MAG TPA: hypothetical protein VMW63_07440 [Methanoregulaceae archaeon]|nr:hypothetical protein [Methanoregulaceae archaeon]